MAALLRHGLLQGRVISSKPQRQLRALTHYRSTLVQDHARAHNRLQAVLEDANLKLASVMTDISGASARAMFAAILAGQRDVEALVALAHGPKVAAASVGVESCPQSVRDVVWERVQG